MTRSPFLLPLRLLVLWTATLLSIPAAGELVRRDWMVDGVRREALVHLPEGAVSGPVPVVFVFHGHGGSALNAANSLPVHRYWPGALVIYPQGLPTPGQLTDREGRQNGWQGRPGDQGDRDLKFFDAMLAGVQAEWHTDPRRIYVTGHSNGGGFTYLLWASRPDVFAAYGPSSAIPGRGYGPLRPAPVIQVAGEQDQLVKFAWQEATIRRLLKLNQCGPGQPAGAGATLYPSANRAPVMTWIHPGGHQLPPEATPQIVAFFKAHPKP